MIYAITFGDDSFYNSAKLNLWTATHIGKADAAKMYRPEDIDSAYREAHKDIFDQKRGAGYWLWKPYVILDALESLQWNDYLMYVDAGVLYYSSMRPLAEQLERDGQDIYFSAGFWRNEYWTKRDTYVLLDCDDESFYSAHRVAAGYMMIKKRHSPWNSSKYGRDTWRTPAWPPTCLPAAASRSCPDSVSTATTRACFRC